MNIPKTYTVGFRPYIIVIKSSIDRGKTNGRTWLNTGVIHLAKNNADGKRTPDDIEQTFWHEAVHTILNDMGSALCDDEYFVDAFANRIHQITKTGAF